MNSSNNNQTTKKKPNNPSTTSHTNSLSSELEFDHAIQVLHGKREKSSSPSSRRPPDKAVFRGEVLSRQNVAGFGHDHSEREGKVHQGGWPATNLNKKRLHLINRKTTPDNSGARQFTVHRSKGVPAMAWISPVDDSQMKDAKKSEKAQTDGDHRFRQGAQKKDGQSERLTVPKGVRKPPPRARSWAKRNKGWQTDQSKRQGNQEDQQTEAKAPRAQGRHIRSFRGADSKGKCSNGFPQDRVDRPVLGKIPDGFRESHEAGGGWERGGRKKRAITKRLELYALSSKPLLLAYQTTASPPAKRF